MLAKKPALVREHRRRAAPKTPPDYRKVGQLRYYVPAFEREFDYTALGRVLKVRLANLLAEACWRRFKIDQLCRLNFDQGPEPDFEHPVVDNYTVKAVS